jgi:hypothetical protein
MAKTRRKVRIRALLVYFVVLLGLYSTWSLLTSPERLSDYVKMILREQLKGRVSLDLVNVGIFSAEVRDLKVQSAREPGHIPLSIGVLRLRPKLSSILRGRIDIEDLVIENPVIVAQRRPNGAWEMEDIFRFAKKRGGANLRISSITIRNASLKLQDERNKTKGSDLLGLEGLNAFASAAPRERGRFLLRGSIDQSLVGPCHIFGSLDLRRNVLELVATREGLPLDQKLAAAIAPFLPEAMKPLALQGGRADLRFDLVYEAAPGGQIDYTSAVSLTGVRAVVGPYHLPLTDVTGEAEIGLDVVNCHGLSGLFNGARFLMKGTVARNPERAPTDMTITIGDLPLDQRLKDLGGPTLAAFWDEVKPTGKLDLLARIHSHEGAADPPQADITVELKDCSVSPGGIPQPISQVNGSLDCTGKRIALKGITGRCLGVPVLFQDATLPTDGTSPLDLQMEIPGVVLDDKLIDTFSGNLKELLKKYRIAGRLDLRCRLTRPPGPNARPQFEATARCQDLRIAYPMLKEPFEHLNGVLRFNDREFIIESAQGVCGRRPITLTGVHIDSSHPGPTAGTITIKNWTVDDELLSFVPAHVRPVVEDLQPRGVVDVDYKILPPVNGHQPAPEMALTFHDGQVAYRAFPYLVRNIQGRLVVTETAVKTEGMIAHDGDATFTIPDQTYDTSGHSTVTIKIHGKNVPLDARLKSAASKESQEFWDLFAPRGHINVDVRVDCIPNREIPLVTAAVDCNGSELTYQPFPYSIRNVRGTMFLTEDGVRLEGVSGEPASGRLAFDNTMLYFDQAKGLTFTIKGTGLRFDDVLRGCLPKQFQTTWDTISPEGAFDLYWHQERKPGKDQAFAYDVAITLDGCNMKYKSLPYSLTHMKGTLGYDGEKVTIQDVTGECGEAKVKILGGVSDPTAEGAVNLTVIGENVPLDDNVRNSLPVDYLAAWDRVKPTGHINFKCNLTYRADEKGERVLEYDVPELEFKDCKVKLDDVGISSIGGIVTLSGEAKNDPKQNWIQGELLSKSLPITITIEGKPYEITRFTFYDEAEAIHVPYFEGWRCGGKVFGGFSINKGEQLGATGWTAEFRAEGMDAGELVRASGLGVKGVEGKFYAESQGEGTGFRLEDLKVRGKMQIRKGKLGELPSVFFKSGGLANAKSFTDANLEYEIANNRAQISKADLTSPVFSLRGKGYITLDGHLQMEFRPEFGSGKGGIPIFGDILKMVVKGVIPVTLTGTLDDPHWKVDPLLPLTKLVKGIADIFAKSDNAKEEKAPEPKAAAPTKPHNPER